MPCKDAMIPANEAITITPDCTVEEAIHIFDQKRIRALPVVNDDNEVLGVFDFNSLLNSLLPVSIPGMENFVGVDIRLDNIIGASPGIAKRLRKRMPVPVRDIMKHDYPQVNPDTQLWEGIRLLVKHVGMVVVLKKDSHKLEGIMTQQSAMSYLLQLVDQQQKEAHDEDEDEEI